jgi:Sec region non-globular protein
LSNSKKSKKSKNSALSSSKKNTSNSTTTAVTGTSTQGNTTKSTSNVDSVNKENPESNALKTNLNSNSNVNSDSTPLVKKTETETTEINTQVTNSGSQELDASLWMDDSLAMQPDYLPGFDGSQSNTKGSDSSKETDSEKNTNSTDEKPNMRPLPQITGNYSIWGSFVDFLSKYQKAFYILEF